MLIWKPIDMLWMTITKNNARNKALRKTNPICLIRNVERISDAIRVTNDWEFLRSNSKTSKKILNNTFSYQSFESLGEISTVSIVYRDFKKFPIHCQPSRCSLMWSTACTVQNG